MQVASSLPMAVIGSGSWGTALAIVLANKGNLTYLWGRNRRLLDQMRAQRQNAEYLKGIIFPELLHISDDLSTLLAKTRDVLLVVPSHAFSEQLSQLAPYLTPHHRVLWGTKGLDPNGRFLFEISQAFLGEQQTVGVLSGPSFALEVAQGLPTTVALATNDDQFLKELVRRFQQPTFCIEPTRDMVGVSLCGAVKNVLAIAAGLLDGLQWGANARCALLTKGLAEMIRLGDALKADPKTFLGVAGLGDLVLTATDNQSRNRRFGLALGEGLSIDAAHQHVGEVVEGLNNAKQVYHLAEQYHVDMPIVKQIHQLLIGEKTKETIHLF